MYFPDEYIMSRIKSSTLGGLAPAPNKYVEIIETSLKPATSFAFVLHYFIGCDAPGMIKTRTRDGINESPSVPNVRRMLHTDTDGKQSRSQSNIQWQFDPSSDICSSAGPSRAGPRTWASCSCTNTDNYENRNPGRRYSRSFAPRTILIYYFRS